MLNNPLWLIAAFAAVSGMSLPQVLEQDWLLVPTHHIAEPVTTALLPVPVLRTIPKKVDTDTGPVLQAKAAIVMDAQSGMVLWQKEPDTVLPIASITKLMTAVTATDSITNWDEPYTLQWGDIAVGGSLFSGHLGDTFSKRDLLKTALVGSINQAAAAVAHSTGLSDDDFAQAMNAMADRLGMTNSSFVEPTGLSAANQSTARDLALLLQSISKQELLLEPMSQAEHRMVRGSEELTFKTTNDLVREQAPYIVAGKTGYTSEAGNCLASIAKDSAGHTIFVVVLGAPDDASRFDETEELVSWTFGHYNWP